MQSSNQFSGGTAFLDAGAWNCSFPSPRSIQWLGSLEHFWLNFLQTRYNSLVLSYQNNLKFKFDIFTTILAIFATCSEGSQTLLQHSLLQ